MNKALFDKVKNLCKDYGLSEKYLQETTLALGGHVEDDSTDTEEIEKVANLVASVAKASQSEATRWAAKKDAKKKKDGDEPKDDEQGDEEKSSKRKNPDDQYEARIKALEDKLAAAEAENAKAGRKSQIEAAMEKHKIPSYLRKHFAKSIGDEDDIEAVVSAFKQELITNGLTKETDSTGAKASDQDNDSAAEDLLKSISTDKK